MGLKDKSDAAASMAGSWPGDSSSPPSPATFLTVNANIKRSPSLKKLLKLPIFGGGGGGGNFLVNILNCYLLVFICVFCMREMACRRMVPLTPSPFSIMMIQNFGLALKLVCCDDGLGRFPLLTRQPTCCERMQRMNIGIRGTNMSLRWMWGNPAVSH